MTKLDLEFIGMRDLSSNIFINGKCAKLKKKKKQKKVLTYSTTVDKAETEIVIYKSHYYYGKNWFWWNLLYFMVSIFGIFDIKQNHKCYVFDSKFTISTKEDTSVVIRKENFTDGGKFITVETNSSVKEISNTQYCDKEARKKHVKMRKIKIAITVVAAVLAAVLVIVL